MSDVDQAAPDFERCGGLVPAIAQDAETGEQLYVDTGNHEFRRRFVEAAQRREATLKQDLKNAGVDLYGVSTDEDLVGAIIRMAILRKKRKR